MKKTLLFAFAFLCFTANAQFTKLLDFAGTSNGRFPLGDLLYVAPYLYGTTEEGGTNNYGTVFKIMPNGTGYVKLLDFNGTNGSNPYCSLVYDGTYLYGTTLTGGTNGIGNIFRIKPDGTGFLTLHTCKISTSDFVNPYGSLYYDGTFLYGLGWQGGIYTYGSVFRIKPDSTGFGNIYSFNGTVSGAYPQGGNLISDGTYLYGMNQSGGANSDGTIFKVLPNGTGYVKLLDFAGSTNGRFPQGSLIYDGTYLYGMTRQGGVNDSGVVFKIKPDGTAYAKLLDFNTTATGSAPQGSLLSDGTNLYGMTAYGGTNNEGVLFAIKPDGSNFAKIIDFAGSSNGNQPWGSLISDGTYLYGMTSEGGVNNDGVIFKNALCSVSASIATSQDVSCNGACDGFAVASASGGTPPYTYGWIPSSCTIQTCTGLCAGPYAVMITDAVGCTATSNVVGITQPQPLTANAQIINNVSCYGGNDGTATVTVNGGTTPYTYLWSPVAGSAVTASNLTAGCYTVSVTDAHGCLTSSTVCITQPSVLTCNATTLQNVSCYQGTDGVHGVTVAGGTLPYIYLWSPAGCTYPTCSNLTAGCYTVSVTDNNGCESTSSTCITEPSVLTCSAQVINNVSCNGFNNGCAYVLASGGTPLYEYSWTPSGSNNDTLCNAVAGTYTVRVTDSHGCTTQSAVTITQPPPLTISLVVTNTSCSSCYDGSIVATANGGTGTYTYFWSPSACCGATVSNLSPNTYTCCVYDANACSVCSFDTVSNPTSVAAISASGNSIIIHPNPFTNELRIIWNKGTVSKNSVSLFDITGKEIIRRETSEEEIILNTENLAAGFYLLRVGVSNYKVVKEN